MTRKASRPIPEEIREAFYLGIWDLAYSGEFVRGCHWIGGKRQFRQRHNGRRHGLVVLWLTAIAGRFSEVRRLRVADVSLADNSVFVQRSKRGKSGRVQVDPTLLSMTLRWRGERSSTLTTEWLIPSQRGNPLNCNAFNRDVCDRLAEMFSCPISSHSFRDTACQLAMTQAQSVKAVQELMGHRSARTTEVYLAKQQGGRIQLGLYSGSVPEGVTDVCT